MSWAWKKNKLVWNKISNFILSVFQILAEAYSPENHQKNQRLKNINKLTNKKHLHYIIYKLHSLKAS